MAPSCGLSPSAMRSGVADFQDSNPIKARGGQAWTGGRGDASVHFFFLLFFSKSGLQFPLVTAEPFLTHIRPGSDHSKGFQDEFGGR